MSWTTISWTLKKITQLSNSYICIILPIMNFCMRECSSIVISLFIFVIYFVQYVWNAYGTKINWIFLFPNNKWTTHILKALNFMFIGVQLKKMCNFVDFFLKLSIHAFSLKFKEWVNSKIDISSFFQKYFKDWILFVCLCVGIDLKIMENSHLHFFRF
jgi:hypothetical protein